LAAENTSPAAEVTVSGNCRPPSFSENVAPTKPASTYARTAALSASGIAISPSTKRNGWASSAAANGA
jgi:hypothetical protein